MIRTIRFFLDKLSSRHPLRIMLYMAMFGSALVFLVFTLGMLSYMGSSSIEKPMLLSLWLGLVALGLSTNFMRLYHRAFSRGELSKAIRLLIWAGFLSLLFGVIQAFGWHQWWDSGIQLATSNHIALFYISGAIHLVHIALGWLFLGLQLNKIRKGLSNQADLLILVNEPYQALRSDLLLAYWYYLDVIWLVLLSVFFCTS